MTRESLRPDTDSMLRVDQAGEYGATRIYAGQLAVMGTRAPAARAIAARFPLNRSAGTCCLALAPSASAASLAPKKTVTRAFGLLWVPPLGPSERRTSGTSDRAHSVL